MKKGSAAVAILGFLAALVAAPAIAQDRGSYFGGTLAATNYKKICSRTDIPCDDEDAGFRAFAGYQFTRHVAAELGFGYLGEASGRGTAGSFTQEAAGADLSAVFSIPMSTRLSLLGRVGVYRVEMTVKQEGPAFGSLTDKAVSSGFLYGAGVGYNLGFLGLRAEYLQYASIGSQTTGEDTAEMFGLTVLFRF